MADPQKTDSKTEAKAPARPRARSLTHKGYLVSSPIRYATPEGVVRSAGVGDIIDDLTEDDRVMFEAKKYIQPHFVAE